MFDIGNVDGLIIIVLKNRTVFLRIFSVGNLVLFIERYWQRSDKKKDKYQSGLELIQFLTFAVGYLL